MGLIGLYKGVAVDFRLKFGLWTMLLFKKKKKTSCFFFFLRAAVGCFVAGKWAPILGKWEKY